MQNQASGIGRSFAIRNLRWYICGMLLFATVRVNWCQGTISPNSMTARSTNYSFEIGEIVA
jgi:hypothetical protein